MKHTHIVKFDKLLKMYTWACTCGRGEAVTTKFSAKYMAETHEHSTKYA